MKKRMYKIMALAMTAESAIPFKEDDSCNLQLYELTIVNLKHYINTKT